MPMQGMPQMTPNRVTPTATGALSSVPQFSKPNLPGVPAGMKRGGVPQFANGGFPSASEAAPWYMRQEAHMDPVHVGGLFGGSAPGRADTLDRSVPVDSHVIPADVVAAVGQGNSLAGGNTLTGMFHSGPWATSLSRGHAAAPLHLSSAPRPMTPESRGGRKEGDGNHGTIPIAASSGEFLVHPLGVYARGMKTAMNLKLDPKKLTPRKIMDIGHDAIDKFIVEVRKREIKAARSRPGPRKD